MTENMQYHVKNKLALTENTFRYGSQAFLDLWAEARYLYSRDAVHLNDEDKAIILETNLGEYGMFEGKKVPLDMPILENDSIGGKEDTNYPIPFRALSDLTKVIGEKIQQLKDFLLRCILILILCNQLGKIILVFDFGLTELERKQ